MSTPGPDRARLEAALAAVLGAAERLLAEARAGRTARVVQDVRRIHEAAGRLHRLLLPGPAGPRTAPSRHEMNNALNHVLGYSELLLEEETAAALRPALEPLVRAARELRTLLAAAAGATSAAEPPAAEAAETVPGAVLVVDDDPVNRDLLTRYLTPYGHHVLVMEHGRWALEILESEAIDVVLLDLEMPKMDGYETLGRLKADPRMRDIPVLVISALDSPEAIVRCLKLGADDFLPKPFNPVLLHARVAASVTKKRLRERELSYLHDVGLITDAAAAIETGAFLPETLDRVATRDDALGRLARVVQRMAQPGRRA